MTCLVAPTSDATNYDMTATLDDLSCVLPCTVSLSLDNVTSPSLQR